MESTKLIKVREINEEVIIKESDQNVILLREILKEMKIMRKAIEALEIVMR